MKIDNPNSRFHSIYQKRVNRTSVTAMMLMTLMFIFYNYSWQGLGLVFLGVVSTVVVLFIAALILAVLVEALEDAWYWIKGN